MLVWVTDGVPADRNRRLSLADRAEAVIGRGAGAHLQLDDPAFNGRLRVDRAGGVFRVTNLMGHPVALIGDDDQPPQTLDDGRSAVWFSGVTLQATNNTLLQLGGAAADATPADPPREWWETAALIGIIVLALPLALFALTQNLDEADGPQPLSAGEVRRLVAELDEDRRQLAGDRALFLSNALAELSAARFDEVSNRPQSAYHRYLAARDLLDKHSASVTVQPDRHAAVVAKAREVATARLLALDRFRR